MMVLMVVVIMKVTWCWRYDGVDGGSDNEGYVVVVI